MVEKHAWHPTQAPRCLSGRSKPPSPLTPGSVHRATTSIKRLTTQILPCHASWLTRHEPLPGTVHFLSAVAVSC